MARVDQSEEERDSQPLQISKILDCPECDIAFDHVFDAPEGVFDREELVDQPEAEVTCPGCEHTWVAICDVWVSTEDAG